VDSHHRDKYGTLNSQQQQAAAAADVAGIELLLKMLACPSGTSLTIACNFRHIPSVNVKHQGGEKQMAEKRKSVPVRETSIHMEETVIFPQPSPAKQQTPRLENLSAAFYSLHHSIAFPSSQRVEMQQKTQEEKKKRHKFCFGYL